MLKAIYAPDKLPLMFSGIKPALKLKTKFIESLTIERPEMSSTDEPILNIWFQNGLYQSVSYSTADIITKKGLKDVVPLILVLQDFNERLYLALTYVKFWAPEPEIKPNQLELF